MHHEPDTAAAEQLIGPLYQYHNKLAFGDQCLHQSLHSYFDMFPDSCGSYLTAYLELMTGTWAESYTEGMPREKDVGREQRSSQRRAYLCIDMQLGDSV